jgi:hypothetical protein
MKKSLLLLAFICGACLLNACGGSSGSSGGTQIGVATHFAVTAPAAVSIGELFNLTVTALDSRNNLVTSYSGFVQFSSTDPNFPLTGGAALVSGMGTFTVSLGTAGSQTITVTDQANSRITGSTKPISVTLGVASFRVTSADAASTGTSFNFIVAALDGHGNTFPDYSGMVSFTSTDGQAVLPANSPLTNGTATFSLKFSTTGIQTITATDTANPLLTGTSSRIQVSAPAVGFTPTGSMSIPRAGHTATLLNDGDVLLVGGIDWDCPPTINCNNFIMIIVKSAETYTAAGGQFSTSAIMSVPRVGHTATLLQDGRVLVTGGGYKSATDSAEIFDPSTSTFTPTGNMTSARSGHTATLLANGKVLLAGGFAGNGNWPATAELFDPATGMFTATGIMSALGPGQTATLLSDGKVLFAGGGVVVGTDLVPTATAEIYDPATGIFTPTGNMNVPRVGHTATLLANSKVLIAGGGTGGSASLTATAELFDEATGLFTPTGNMVTARFDHTATLLTNGKVLLTGGFSGLSSDLSSAESFDPSNGTFTIAGNMGIQRIGHTATLLNNGEVLITGGNNLDGAVSLRTLATAELFP